MLRTCVICDIEFDAHRNAVTCSRLCSAERKRLYDNGWRNERNASDVEARETKNQRQRGYVARNHEAVKQRAREAYRQNCEAKKRKVREYRARNREAILQRQKEDRIQNPERYRQYGLANYAKHREKINQRSREAYRKNREARIRYWHEYRIKYPERVDDTARRYYRKNYETLQKKWVRRGRKYLAALRAYREIFGRTPDDHKQAPLLARVLREEFGDF